MSYYKTLFKNYVVLIALILFAVIYIILNLDAVKRGDIYSGDLTKSILLTGIIILLTYLFVTWDDDKEIYEYSENISSNNMLDEPLKFKKFNLGSIPNNQPTIITNIPVTTNPIPNTNSGPIINPENNQIANPVINIQNQLPNQNNQIPNKAIGESKYYILNQNPTAPIKAPNLNPLINLTNNKNPLNRYDNPNIFISQKNMGKFGIKF